MKEQKRKILRRDKSDKGLRITDEAGRRSEKQEEIIER